MFDKHHVNLTNYSALRMWQNACRRLRASISTTTCAFGNVYFNNNNDETE